MGIFSRISKLLESNVNALVERAEDPSKMLDQAIEDMKKGLEESRQAIVDARTQQKLSERRRDKARTESVDCEKKAMRALELGDENLARKLLELKLAADERSTGEEVAIEQRTAEIAQIEIAQKELERRLRELPARRASLLARKAAAEARGATASKSSRTKNSVSDALEAFERMEEKIIRAEVEADVKSESNPQSLDLRLLESGQADQALEALKGKMRAQLTDGRTPAPARPPANEKHDPVDDSLAALKARLKPKS